MAPKEDKQLRKAIADIEKRAAAEGWHAAVTCLKLAHAYASHGSKAEAVANYLRAADHYSETGFEMKVVVVLKQLLKVSPDHAMAQERLSSLVATMESPPEISGLHAVIQKTPGAAAPTPRTGADAWAIVTDKIRRKPRPPSSPGNRARKTGELPVLDVSGKVRPVGAPVRPLLLVDGREQHAHARRLDLHGRWQVAMACQPLSDDGEAHALVLLKGGRAFLGMADGARDRPGGEAAADRVCVEIRRLRSAVDPNVALQTIDRVLKDVPDGGQATGMLVAITEDRLTGASVGDLALFSFQDHALQAIAPEQNRKDLLGSGLAHVATFDAAWGGTLLAANAGVARYLPERAITRCLSLPDVGEAAQALLSAVRLPNGTLREDAMVVVLRRGTGSAPWPEEGAVTTGGAGATGGPSTRNP